MRPGAAAGPARDTARMSQANVEAVRLAYDVAYAERNIESVRAAVAAGWVFHGRSEFPGRQEYGLEEMPQLWADLDETYSEFSLTPEEFTPVGDDHVVVEVRTSARLRGSEARMEATQYHVWRVQAGKVRETWAYNTRQEALDAIGLRD